MGFLIASQAEEFLADLVYAKKQVHKNSIDLTAKKIYKLAGGGKLDFGGSEYEKAPANILKPEFKDKDDNYGWWNLEKGFYIVKYNESLAISPTQKAIILPHERLVEAAASHPVSIYDKSGEIKSSLIVHEKLSIKENARISSLYIYEN